MLKWSYIAHPINNMNNLKAIKRENTTTGQINKLRSEGLIPAIIYGGKDPNAKI